MIRNSVVVIGVLLGVSSRVVKPATDVRVNQFLVGAPLTEWAMELSRAAQVPICSEMARWAPPPGATKHELQLLKEKRSRGRWGVTWWRGQKTIASALDEAVAKDADYRWEEDKDTGIINLFPAQDGPAGWTIGELRFVDKTFREIFVVGDLLGLKAHGIRFHPGWGDQSWLETRASIDAEDAPLRVVLNRLCRQLAFPATWHISDPRDPTGRLQRVPGPELELMFVRIEPPRRMSPANIGEFESQCLCYLKLADGTFAPGYLAEDGTFLEPAGKEPLKALPDGTASWRCLRAPVRSVITIAKPAVHNYTLVTSEGPAAPYEKVYAPVWLSKASKCALLVRGFAEYNVHNYPFRVSGPGRAALADLKRWGYDVKVIRIPAEAAATSKPAE